MFNKTNLIIGAIYAVSAVTGGLIVLGVQKISQNEYRLEKKAVQKAIAATDDYLESVYRMRVNLALKQLEDSGAQTVTVDSLRDLLDCSL